MLSFFLSRDYGSRRAQVGALLRGAVLACVCCMAANPLAAQAANTADGLETARHLLDTPNWKDAEAIVRSELVRHPQSQDAHALLGLILYRKHQPRASMAEYVEASKLGDMTGFDLRIFALDLAALPNYPEAEKWLLRAIEKDEHDAASWEALGHVRFAQQQYQGAIDALTHALELAPRTVSMQTLIGLSQERMAHLDEAQAAYKTAIEWQAASKPKDAVPLVGLGRVLLANNDAKAAIAPLEQAVAVPEAPAEAHELLGQAYAKTGRNADAAAQLEMAVHLDVASARLHLMLARVYRDLGAQAKADAEQAEYARLKASGVQ